MIPVNEPLLGETELRVRRRVRRDRLDLVGGSLHRPSSRRAGPPTAARRHGVAVSNGTAALRPRSPRSTCEPGDEVILPTFTIISCALRRRRRGRRPGARRLPTRAPGRMDVDEVAARITPRTRAIMPVHIYGHPVDMDPLLALAGRARACRSSRTPPRRTAPSTCRRGAAWRRCGSFGDAELASASTPTSSSPPAKAAWC